MKIFRVNIVQILIILSVINLFAQENWTHKVRICGNPLSENEIESIIQKAGDSFVSGIEVDNDITGRYDSFLDPAQKLSAIRKITEEAHKINNHTFVYIAGLECITSDAENKEHTFYKDHPDWVQRDMTGRPAIFGGNDAFWIAEGDEDVWISPYAKEWRKIYMQRVREITATGIDGIYVDIPYWMTHFEGWENTWASFDDYTVEEFKQQTGLDARKDIKLGDYVDQGFIKWLNFRMQTLTDFMREINQNVKAVNPECKTIAEIYPGISEDAVRVGADVYKMYEVVDAIAHEYSEGEYYASNREPYDWYNYIIGMQTFRAFAGDKASWMLIYSWYDNKNVEPAEAMKSLFVSQLFSGTNMWDVKGYVMSSTNDMETRTEVYKWAAKNEDIFYSKRTPIEPISVYFSDITRNYFSEEFTDSYRGILNLLIHSHLPFQIVTARTIDQLNPKILILPDVKCITDNEAGSIKKLTETGTKFIVTGELAEYNEKRQLLNSIPLEDNLLWLTGFFNLPQSENYIVLKDCPGKSYTDKIKKELNNYFKSGNSDEMSAARDTFISELSGLTSYVPEIKIEAPVDLIATSGKSEDYVYLYLTNVRALNTAYGADNKTVKNVSISYSGSIGSDEVYVLPFLGEPGRITSRISGNVI
ncbi:MAG TPA: hypothetical protein VLB50_06780, partial [Ignavibacteriaceae bacterium]|nr:hypothetical protein [Ignavibacteriaceae bacterium]